MERSSLTFQTFKNVTYSIIGYVWPMIFTLCITPIVIFRLGVKDYGIYLFINSIISLLGILDFGISTAITKHMAHYHGKNSQKELVTLIHSSNSLFLIISILGFIVTLLIALLGPRLLPNEFASYAQYSTLFILAGAIFVANSIDVTYTIILISLQRFDITNLTGMVFTTLSSLSMLAIVVLGGSLQAMLISTLILNSIFAVITYYYAKKILPIATFKFGWDKTEIKKNCIFGAVTAINNIANTALASLDRLIIPFYVGPSNLTYYSVPGNVTSRIPAFANTISSTIFPMASQLDGQKDKARIETFYVRSFRLITIFATALTVTVIAFSYKILLFWLSIDFAVHSTSILIILAVTNFILALFGPLSSFLLGLGKLKFLTAMSLLMGIINAILLLLLLPTHGITGAAWAYLLSILPVAYMFYYTEKKYLDLADRRKYYSATIRSTIITAVTLWLIDTYLLSGLITDLVSLIVIMLVSCVMYIIIYKILGFFDESDWNDIERFQKVLFAKYMTKKRIV